MIKRNVKIEVTLKSTLKAKVKADGGQLVDEPLARQGKQTFLFNYAAGHGIAD